jgi:3-hydroxybutyryl-CoA dehydrogenase
MSVDVVGVVGTGTMGAGIAEVASKAGFDVILRGRSLSAAQLARARVATSLAKQVDKGRLAAADRDDAVERLRVTADLADLKPCDIVIESVVEDLGVKQALFGELDRVCPPDAILATNTSTLPVGHIAMATERPRQVVGLHFFNPASRMPLVEVVPAHTTAPGTLATIRGFAEACGKVTVTAKDRPGFVVNALLFPYLNAAVQMLAAGTASREDIDAAMRGGCGFPMGPFELLDLIGLDTSLSILGTLHQSLGDPSAEPAKLLKDMVGAGRLGRKTGSGFYQY